jgi:hypothetical protein
MRLGTRNFANSATASGILSPETPNLSPMFANVFTSDDHTNSLALRWACLAPYGDWPNAQGLQRFQKPDAQNIVNEFNSMSNLPQQLLGAPWYVGHPDHPAFKDKYKDGSAKGRIKKLEVRDDGLYAGVKFNPEGEKLIADEAYQGHSVNWYLKQDPADKKAWRPFQLKSVGFTNEPNIPVPPVTTANETVALTSEQIAANSERYRRVARVRFFANAGTSEGGNSAWESRVSKAGSASALADLASKRAGANPSEDAHNKASDAHEAAASAQASVGNKEKAQEHTSKAEDHDQAAATMKQCRFAKMAAMRAKK